MISFKVYPDPKGKHFFHVRIFPTIKTMRKNAKYHPCMKSYAHWDWAALSHGHDLVTFTRGSKSGKLLPELGIMWFSLEQLTAEIASHECTHSALRWAVRMKVRPFSGIKAEERFCYAQGEMVKQFWHEVYTRARRWYLKKMK